MNDLLHTLEQLDRGVEALVGGEGNARDKLMEAAIEIHGIRPDSLPEELRAEFLDILSQLTKNPSKPCHGLVREGRVEIRQTGRLGATIPYMQTARVRELSLRIKHLCDRVRIVADG